MKAGIALRYFSRSSSLLIGNLLTSLSGAVVVIITGRLVGTALYCSYVLTLISSNVIITLVQ